MIPRIVVEYMKQLERMNDQAKNVYLITVMMMIKTSIIERCKVHEL